MPFNGAGNFTPASPQYPAVAGTLIKAADWNAVVLDIANGLTNCITRDGQSPATANIPFGGFRLAGVGAANSLTDGVNGNDVQTNRLNTLTGVAGTNTITAACTGLAAYTAGQYFIFIPANSNAGAATLNINGIGAKSIFRNANQAVDANDLLAGEQIILCYDGVQFQLVNSRRRVLMPAIAGNGLSVAAFTGIPSWANSVEVLVSDSSVSTGNMLILQLGTSLGYEVATYQQYSLAVNGAATFVNTNTDAFYIQPIGNAAGSLSALAQLTKVSGNTWVCSATGASLATGYMAMCSGTKVLAAALDRIRVIVQGAGTIDTAGSLITVAYSA